MIMNMYIYMIMDIYIYIPMIPPGVSSSTEISFRQFSHPGAAESWTGLRWQGAFAGDDEMKH